jgi:uncharacterized phage infection (PIP) family protein YhgE
VPHAVNQTALQIDQTALQIDQTALQTVHNPVHDTAQEETPAQRSTDQLSCTLKDKQASRQNVTSSANQTAEQAKHALYTVGKANALPTVHNWHPWSMECNA